MLVMLQQSYDELSREAARTIASAVRKKPSLTLGRTGRTMIGMYQELVRMHQRRSIYDNHEECCCGLRGLCAERSGIGLQILGIGATDILA